MNNAKRKKPATMRDVARLAGVSQPTVSRVLNQTDTSISISDATREKVIAAINELGYRPNMHARSLRTQKTQMIALLLADITNSFYPQIARSIQNVAREKGYDVIISSSDHRYEYERLFCESITFRPVDGAIMVPVHLQESDFHDLYKHTQVPIAILGQHVELSNADFVYVDDKAAIFEATSWLIREKDHTRLGYVGVPDIYPPGPRRYQGFMRAMQEADLSVNPNHIFEGDFTLDQGRVIGQKLAQMEDRPTALMVANDTMALGIILTLQEAGIRVPEDVAIVGMDDIPEASIIRPALTTIEQNSASIGYQLARLLFDRIDNPDLPSRREEIPFHLRVRGSA
jgi:LacI family transcriptional regulator